MVEEPKTFDTITILKKRIRIHSCPLTAGYPTRMTDAGFKRACAMLRAGTDTTGKMVRDNALYRVHCDKCNGAPPKELEIIQLDNPTEGREDEVNKKDEKGATKSGVRFRED